MAVKIIVFGDGHFENCAMCFHLTDGWYEENDVALCPTCAKKFCDSDIPNKEDWLDAVDRHTCPDLN